MSWSVLAGRSKTTTPNLNKTSLQISGHFDLLFHVKFGRVLVEIFQLTSMCSIDCGIWSLFPDPYSRANEGTILYIYVYQPTKSHSQRRKGRVTKRTVEHLFRKVNTDKAFEQVMVTPLSFLSSGVTKWGPTGRLSQSLRKTGTPFLTHEVAHLVHPFIPRGSMQQ